MEKVKGGYVAHCLVLAIPVQGHIAPLLQFSKRLGLKGVRVTFVSTFFVMKNLPVIDLASNNNITLETISDGFDDGGFEKAESHEAYRARLRRVGQQTLSELLRKLASSGRPVDCIVYDLGLNWALDVAKSVGLLAASFLTQPCAVGSIYFHAHKKWLNLPLSDEDKASGISIPGLPLLAPSDLPSYLYQYGSYPVFLDGVLNQFCNIDKVDWVLANTFNELEQEVVEWIKKFWPLKTIGPTVPSMFLDKRIQDDTQYGLSLFKPNDEACMKWLDDKPKGSVVYVSFGSIVALSEAQMEEMAWGLNESEYYFLWVVRASEESKLPKNFTKTTSKKGIIVTWCSQLQVLSHEAVGCFITHCGWNSILEALCLGVPMIGVPQCSDQNTNAKLVMDVWKIGITARVNEKGCVTRQEVKHCVKEIIEAERGNEIKSNVIYWRNMARKDINEGGSSNKNFEEFVQELVRLKHKNTCSRKLF